MAQLVNAIAPIRTTPTGLLRQATYYPFALYRRLMGGVAITADVEVDGYDARVASLNTKAMTVHAPYLDTVATIDLRAGTITCAVVNRSVDSAIEAAVNVVGGRAGAEVEVWTITGPDLEAENTFDHPDVVTPTYTVADAGALDRFLFPAGSVTLLRWHTR